MNRKAVLIRMETVLLEKKGMCFKCRNLVSTVTKKAIQEINKKDKNQIQNTITKEIDDHVGKLNRAINLCPKCSSILEMWMDEYRNIVNK